MKNQEMDPGTSAFLHCFCEQCNSIPCTCGWQYRKWSDERIASFIAGILTCKGNKKDILERAEEIIKLQDSE